jgi:asparagine synthase (glutamine-hydrolysing)
MCGIAGILNLKDLPPEEISSLLAMLGTIRHRGPDEFGIFRDAFVGLGSARLKIVDLVSGGQPISNEDGRLWIVFNGEIYNYPELRADLVRKDHRFSTTGDTEVILHLYEEYGIDCLGRLNGQFVFAIWDAVDRRMFIARDRLGIRPLFYTSDAGKLVFASEIKALLAYPGVNAVVDSLSLEQAFKYWCVLPPRTIFENIFELPPGNYMLVENGSVDIHPYWSLNFSENPHTDHTWRNVSGWLDEFEYLLKDATRLRLRADVPVGAYLSGGLDSAITATIARSYYPDSLQTFSIEFDDPEFDESSYQRSMTEILDVTHHRITCANADIARAFPDVIWHTEAPLLRTSPAPMYLLSRLVQEQGLKVVLTGEGADETLAGYDIFKEMKVRRFWARHPESRLRPLLLGRLYPHIPGLTQANAEYVMAFFRKGLSDTTSPFYSHALRWNNTARSRLFLLGGRPDQNDLEDFNLPAHFEEWSALAKAQYLEFTTFLSPYLLSSQGDRMAMAHSVEGRYPFLDHRLVELCNSMPDDLKLFGLIDKWLLRQLGSKLLPEEIWQRPKRPYRAPIQSSFFSGKQEPEYTRELLSKETLRDSGLFKPQAVVQLIGKAKSGLRLSEVDNMALVGILSTQLIYQMFVKTFQPSLLGENELTKVVDGMLYSK